MKYTRKEGGRIHIGSARHVKKMAAQGELAAVWLTKSKVYDFVLLDLGHYPIRPDYRISGFRNHISKGINTLPDSVFVYADTWPFTEVQ